VGASGNTDDLFSLVRFEQAAYGHRIEEAAQELVRLLSHLDREYGRLADVGTRPSGDAAQDARDVHFITRIAAAATALFAAPEFRLTDLGFTQVVALQRWLAILFGATPFATMDHVIRLLNRSPAEQGIVIANDDALRFFLLYCLDSGIPLEADRLWSQQPRLAGAMLAALLASRLVVTPQAHERREALLEWLPARLGDIRFEDLPFPVIHDVWMHCSYAFTPRKHDIKEALNRLIRARLEQDGLRDVVPRDVPGRDKPVVLCILEWFDSRHAMFRCYCKAIEALRGRFRVVGISLRGATDDASRAVFDDVRVVNLGQGMAHSLGQIRAIADELQPQLVYYPSVGMFPETVLLCNLRLAPVQAMSIGHPASSRSAAMDYVFIEEDMFGDASCFSERVLALPARSLPFVPPVHKDVVPAQRKADGIVRIAVTASVMKLNPVVLGALARMAEQARAPVEFHFFCVAAVGVAKVYLQAVLQQQLPGRCVVHPHQSYEGYAQGVGGCDLFVSPFPFGNTNGIVDCVRLGLPGVCMTGAEAHSHIDEGLFTRLGLPQWLVARDVDGYCAAVVRLVDGHAERQALVNRIRKQDPDAVLFEGNPEVFGHAVAWLLEEHPKLGPTQPGQVLRAPLPPAPRKRKPAAKA
jgi:hypothetical protein